jgi:hypothetical protein
VSSSLYVHATPTRRLQGYEDDFEVEEVDADKLAKNLW